MGRAARPLCFSSSPCLFAPQSTTSSFKEQCGLPTVTKLKQCIQSLATRLQAPDGAVGATMVLREGYPFLEPLANLVESTRKLVTAYNMVSNKSPGNPGCYPNNPGTTGCTWLYINGPHLHTLVSGTNSNRNSK